MEPVSGSNDSNNERRPVRRVVRQRQPADPDRGRRAPSHVPVAPAEPVTPTPPPVEDTGPRPCPFCGEEVSAKAVVCRHCHRDLVAANGVRLVLTSEKWNTKVPEWMVEQEKQFLQRRSFARQARGWWRQGLLAVVAVLLVAIVYRLLTAPLPPHLQRTMSGKSGHESPVSSLAMESADEAQTRQTPPATSPSPVAKASGFAPSTLAAKPVETVVSMPARELARRFQVDHAQADDLYKDQMVRLSGTVKTAETSAQTPFITLDVPSGIELRCYLGPNALGKLTRMRPGKQILIEGRCQGWFNNIVLADCDLP